MKRLKEKEKELKNPTSDESALMPSDIRQNKSELIESMTEKQAKETLLYISGEKKGTPKTERVKEFFKDKAQELADRMISLSRQDDNLNVAYQATRDGLDRAGISNDTGKDEIKHLIGENEAILILKRRLLPKIDDIG